MADDMESVIQGALDDAGDVPVAESAPEPVASDATPEPVEGAEPVVADPVDDETDPFAKEHGYRSKRPDGRENRIPHSRVQKIAANASQKVISQIAKELGITKAEAELKIEDLVGGITESKTKYADVEGKLASVSNIEKIMGEEPERFIKMLSEVNPAYKRFADLIDAGADPKAAAAAAAKAAMDDDPEPVPDYDLGDGRMTYSMDGLNKVRAWDRRQAVKDAEGRLGERIKPWEEREKAEAAKAADAKRRDETSKQADERITAKFAKWRKWTGWTENEKAIIDAVKASNGTLDPEDAYHQVVMPKLAAERTTMRQELLAELKKAPLDTSGGVVAKPAGGDKQQSMEDIINAAVAAAGLKT